MPGGSCVSVCVYVYVDTQRQTGSGSLQDRSTVGPHHYLSTAARRKHLFRTGEEKRQRRREWRCDIGNKITTVRRVQPLPSLSLTLPLPSALVSVPVSPPPIPCDPFSLSSSAPDLAVYSLYSALPLWNNLGFYKSFVRSNFLYWGFSGLRPGLRDPTLYSTLWCFYIG